MLLLLWRVTTGSEVIYEEQNEDNNVVDTNSDDVGSKDEGESGDDDNHS